MLNHTFIATQEFCTTQFTMEFYCVQFSEELEIQEKPIKTILDNKVQTIC